MISDPRKISLLISENIHFNNGMANILEEKCPDCGTEGAYQGFSVIECPNPQCKHYKPEEPEQELKGELAASSGSWGPVIITTSRGKTIRADQAQLVTSSGGMKILYLGLNNITPRKAYKSDLRKLANDIFHNTYQINPKSGKPYIYHKTGKPVEKFVCDYDVILTMKPENVMSMMLD